MSKDIDLPYKSSSRSGGSGPSIHLNGRHEMIKVYPGGKVKQLTKAINLVAAFIL